MSGSLLSGVICQFVTTRYEKCKQFLCVIDTSFELDYNEAIEMDPPMERRLKEFTMRRNQFEIFSSSVLQLAKTVQQIKSRKMAEYGLKGTNALCLCEIMESGEEGLSATELSHCCEIDKAQVSRCMNELIEKGFVYRNDLMGRRYKQKYRLTSSGLDVAQDIDATVQRLQKVLRKGLSAEDVDHFYRTLDVFCENSSRLTEA